ncbi:RDD family protein [Emticicia fluvialis]|uniref:RDD family protein n=1 Tax=Emticicia fluvialis TaxID=2974474 RepID=UPI002165CEBD|nr:RDD family protein [Emticicia fluvialis]
MKNVQFAGFGKRLVAYLLDGFILGMGLFLLLIPFGGIFAFLGFNDSFYNSGEDISPDEIASLAVAGISIFGIILLALIAPIIYDTLFTASSKQGTLGMQIMRIKVVKENGQPLTMGDAFIRALVKFVTGQFCGLLFLICLFNKEEQNLHDLAARTFVVES